MDNSDTGENVSNNFAIFFLRNGFSIQLKTFIKVQDGKHQFNVLLKDIVNFSHQNLKTRNFNKKYIVNLLC